MNNNTNLLRQVHPQFIQHGKVTSQAFTPSQKDNGELSVYDGDRLSPEEAHTHYTNVLKFCSTGVLSITKNDCNDLELVVSRKPLENFDEHVIIDFNGLGKNQIKRKAKILRNRAEKNGWLYQLAV